jgi:hypothetical protein
MPARAVKTRARTSPRPYRFATVPLHWLERALDVGVRAARVGAYLWYLAGVKRDRSLLRVSTTRIAEEMGSSRTAAHRGLVALHDADLIVLTTRERHMSIVDLPDDATLLRWLDDDNRGGD